MVMDDFRVEIIMFLIHNGFEFGEDFSMDANGDLMVGNPETFSALTELLEYLREREV
jgi:hypothetical protein